MYLSPELWNICFYNSRPFLNRNHQLGWTVEDKSICILEKVTGVPPECELRWEGNSDPQEGPLSAFAPQHLQPSATYISLPGLAGDEWWSQTPELNSLIQLLLQMQTGSHRYNAREEEGPQWSCSFSVNAGNILWFRQ